MGKVYSINKYRKEGVPATVITGLPESGKTQLYQRLRMDSPHLQFEHLDIERYCIEEDGQSEVLIPELIADIQQKAGDRSTDHLVLEVPYNTDISVIVDLFAKDPANTLFGYCYLNSIVAIVDAASLTINGQFSFGLRTARSHPPDEDTELIEALIERLELCDSIYVQNSSVLTLPEQEKLQHTLRRLQSRAEILWSHQHLTQGSSRLLAQQYETTNTEWGATRRQVIEEYRREFSQPSMGLANPNHFLYRTRIPFHPDRFWELLNTYPRPIFRTYGSVWIASKNDVAFTLSQFGDEFITLTTEGKWIDAMDAPSKEWVFENHPESSVFWDERYGDRFTELVFVGDEFDRAELVWRLNHCLLTREEFQSDWSHFPDPIPQSTEGTSIERSQLRLIDPERPFPSPLS